jgi:predicted NUDIX family phosphoesterase
MKYALCVENYQVFNKFYTSEGNPTLPFIFLNRDFCENPKICANTQVIPTITIVTEASDKYKILSYIRPSKNNEKRLANKQSVVFGGHIDSIEDIGLDTLTKEHLTKRKIFTLTKEQFKSVLQRVRARELKEELNIDILNYKPQKIVEHIIYDTSSEVSSLHIGVNAFYYFDEETYNKLYNDIKYEKDEIDCINEQIFDYEFLNEIKEKGLQEYTLEVLDQIGKELNFEDWGIVALKEFFKMHTN